MVFNLEAVLTRCGFNEATRDFFTAQDITSVVDLVLLPTDLKDFIDHVVKSTRRDGPLSDEDVAAGVAEPICFPYPAVRKLKAFRLWLDFRQLRHQECNAALFELDTITEWVSRVDELQLLVDADKIPPAPIPPLLSFAKWPEWEEQFRSYLSHFRGTAGKTPLTYVIRDHAVVTDQIRDATYESIDDTMIHTIYHHGSRWNIDNRKVFDILKSLTVTGPGWTFIQCFNRTLDGRGAFIRLKSQAEGRSAQLTRQAKAHGEIRDATYSGKGKYTIDQYVTRHQKAHNELLSLGCPVTETTKVQDFLRGITDPKLEVAKAVVDGDPTKYGNFEECQQYFKTMVENARTRNTKATDNRNVSAVSFEKRPASAGRSKKGRGHAKTDNGPRPSIHGGHYTPREYSMLTKAEKDKVKLLRDAADGAKKRKASAIQSDDDRQVSSVASDNPVKEDVEDDTPILPTDATGTAKHAGNQFGRKAYVKKTKFAAQQDAEEEE
jgi:hypothetical protein